MPKLDKELLEEFLRHRETVIRRRTQFLLSRARQRKHTVEGLLLAHANIDEVIRVIRSSSTQAEAKERRRRITIVLSAVAAVVVIVLGIAATIQLGRAKSAVTVASGGTPAGLVNDGFQVGSPSAKVTVTLYEDFYCSNCGVFEKANRDALAQYVAAGKIKLIYHTISILDQSAPYGDYPARAANAAAADYTADPVDFQKFH